MLRKCEPTKMISLLFCQHLQAGTAGRYTKDYPELEWVSNRNHALCYTLVVYESIVLVKPMKTRYRRKYIWSHRLCNSDSFRL